MRRGQLLALSLPSFVFTGYELARRTYLPVLLVGAARLDMAQAGLILTIVGTWSILVEVLFGMVCDLAPWPGRRRAFWVATGTVLQWIGGVILWLGPPTGRSVQMWLLGLLPLASGWVLSNLAHGAWALEQGEGIVARGQVFGARARAGMAGSIAFTLAILWSERQPVMPDAFHILLALTMLGAPLAHGWLIWRVAERAGPAMARLDLAAGLKPFLVCIASPADRLLAMLFLLTGAHMAVIGSSFLFITRQHLLLPDWGTAALLVQALAAIVGTGVAPGLLHRIAPLPMLGWVFAVNLGLALVLPALPVGQVVPLMLWSAGCGATMAVDFMLLRVLLGQRLDRDRMRDGDAPSAAFYAGFHLPFNMGAVLATALLFRALAWFGGNSAVWLTSGLSAFALFPALGLVLMLHLALRREAHATADRKKLNIRIFKKEKSFN